jgi:putative oxidoreductase
MTPELLENAALLLLRVVLSLVFLSSGWKHAQEPQKRAESVGLPGGVTLALGVAEVAAGISVALGVLPQAGALVMILAMLGAIYKKVFVWKTGFYGEDNGGWYYDLLYLSAALVVVATGGGAWIVV